jgi:hypothetical protein
VTRSNEPGVGVTTITKRDEWTCNDDDESDFIGLDERPWLSSVEQEAELALVPGKRWKREKQTVLLCDHVTTGKNPEEEYCILHPHHPELHR